MKCDTKTFAAACAGPLLLAAVVSAKTSSATYKENRAEAKLLKDTCDWNVFMCCWSGHEEAFTDVCRVLDYPGPGETLEFPGDDEGPVYCHGFGWDEGAGVTTNILPLYLYVKNLGRTDGEDFHDSVEGAPMCGCIEDMPVVDDAECSRVGGNGIEPCGVSLRRQYKKETRMDEPYGPMDINLVSGCDNRDMVDFDFQTCEYNTYMCCWTENDGLGMKDNTDVCSVGGEEYPGDSEGDVHCHGFVWPEDATDVEIALLAQYVVNFNHKDKKGYSGQLPDAPMCGCIEDMPVVSRADCTIPDGNLEKDVGERFSCCDGNDLERRFIDLYGDADVLDNLVDVCDNNAEE